MAGIDAPVSLTKVIGKFGGGNSLSEYVRNGARVPDNAANAAISTTVSGLSLASFLGADVNTVALVQIPQPINVRSRDVNGGTECRAEIRFYATGAIHRYTNQAGLQQEGTWLLSGGGAASDYEIYCTQNSGIALTVGSINTWLDMGTNRTWRLATSTNDRIYDAELTFQIRRKSDGAIMATGNVSLNVTKGLA